MQPESFDIVFRRKFFTAISTTTTKSTTINQIQSQPTISLSANSFLYYCKEILTIGLIILLLICLVYIIKVCLFPIVR